MGTSQHTAPHSRRRRLPQSVYCSFQGFSPFV